MSKSNDERAAHAVDVWSGENRCDPVAMFRHHPLVVPEEELTQAIESERFIIPRYDVFDVELPTLANWLEFNLPSSPISKETRDALLSDILYVAQQVDTINPTKWFRLRIFTERPTTRCGFHVDTVPPGAPTWGAIKVYNGTGTLWVSPKDVRSMDLFYRHLQRHENHRRLQLPDQGHSPCENLTEFCLPYATINHVEPGTTAFFKHINADRHGSDHPTDQAWIHSSPSDGPSRLVVNLSPGANPARYRPT
ncbi:hypothetical protein [Marinimicrobium locisalis]|uniref:hypothetical protein n=1 Tax=Marinimicrobium locisalis TaxID=546022 RepID=UPI003221A551